MTWSTFELCTMRTCRTSFRWASPCFNAQRVREESLEHTRTRLARSAWDREIRRIKYYDGGVSGKAGYGRGKYRFSKVVGQLLVR